MIKLSHIHLWLRCCCAALLMSCIVVATTPTHAQERSGDRTAGRNPAVATDGATLIHGNYCGAGNRPGKPPIDALDLACMNHDACTPRSGIPTCDCNERLRDEAAAISLDSRQAPELRSLASLTSAAAAVMLCKPTFNAAVPPVPAAPAQAAPAPGTPVAITPAPVGAPVSIVPDAVAPVSSAPATAGSETPVPPVAITDAPEPAPRSPPLP